jgi:hypothetical protein
LRNSGVGSITLAGCVQVTLALKDQQALVGLALSHLHDQPKPHDKAVDKGDKSDVLSPFQVLEAIVDQLHLIGADHWVCPIIIQLVIPCHPYHL